MTTKIDMRLTSRKEDTKGPETYSPKVTSDIEATIEIALNIIILIIHDASCKSMSRFSKSAVQLYLSGHATKVLSYFN